MSLEDTTEQMAGLIPVAVTAGMAMKMVDWMGSKMQPVQPAPRKRKKQDVYSRQYSGPVPGGDFSNLGL